MYLGLGLHQRDAIPNGKQHRHREPHGITPLTHPGAGASSMFNKANHHPGELLLKQHTSAAAWSSGGFGLAAFLQMPFLLPATGVGQSSSSVWARRPPQGWLGSPGTASQRDGEGKQMGSWKCCLRPPCPRAGEQEGALCWVLGSPVALLPPAESPQALCAPVSPP